MKKETMMTILARSAWGFETAEDGTIYEGIRTPLWTSGGIGDGVFYRTGVNNAAPKTLEGNDLTQGLAYMRTVDKVLGIAQGDVLPTGVLSGSDAHKEAIRNATACLGGMGISFASGKACREHLNEMSVTEFTEEIRRERIRHRELLKEGKALLTHPVLVGARRRRVDDLAESIREASSPENEMSADIC